MKTHSSAHDRNQLGPSIEKLFHYLAVYVKQDTTIEVFDPKLGGQCVFSHKFQAPREVSISPTLYTRLDDCHGAGNCCRVPFDLVYTDFDRQRIINHDYSDAIKTFGQVSADGFDSFKQHLLDSLTALNVTISYVVESVDMQTGLPCYHNVVRHEAIWAKRNTEKFHLSNNKSCPYLITGDDRYFCGIHPFKPLHCWYPHMTVRSTKPRVEGERPSVTIGRMQYGRNHNFGCPVIFTEAIEGDKVGLFGDIGNQGDTYFAKQFCDDFDKLQWTANSAMSVGLGQSICLAAELHEVFNNAAITMKEHIASGKPAMISLWKNNDDKTNAFGLPSGEHPS